MDQLSDTIYKRMLGVRKQAGLSQEDFARTVGTSRSIISQIEIGKIKPSYEVLIKTVNLFNLSYRYMLEGKEEVSATYSALQTNASAADSTTTNFELERLKSENGMLKEQVSSLKDLVDTQKILIDRLK